MKVRVLTSLLWVVVLLVVACGPAVAPTAGPATTSTAAPATSASPLPSATPAPSGLTLKVMTHDSFDVSEDVVAAFEQQCNCQVQFLRAGDAGLMLNQALLSKDNPLADVIYGVDNTFLSRALQGGILESYESPLLAHIPGDLQLDRPSRCCRWITATCA